jgi:hypothetical protein
MADELNNEDLLGAGFQLDAHTIERIARRVAEILRSESQPASSWLTAAGVAKTFAVSRAWVYDNADRLGAERLGSGTRARLRFDPDRVRAYFDEVSRERRAAPPRAPSARRWVPEADLIPIRGH